MDFFSQLKKLSETVDDVNDAAEDFGKSTVEDFGEPAYSLYTSLELADMHQRIDVMDADGKLKYYTKSDIILIQGKTDLFDAEGNYVAHLEKRPISLHQKHFITVKDGRNITLSTELFHIVQDVTNIEGLGWQIRGNIVGLAFNLVDEHGNPVATISRKALSIHDKYKIDMYQPEQEAVVVAIVIQLEKMLEQRRLNETANNSSND